MRSVKHGRKRGRRRINYNKNVTNARKKTMKKRKAMNSIACQQLRMSWDKKATVRQNLKVMGLAYDPNKLFKLRPTILNECEEMDIDVSKNDGSSETQQTKKLKSKKSIKKGSKAEQVITALEKEAKYEEEKQKKGRTYRLSKQDIRFCVALMEKHGDNYYEMSRDPKNIYQETSKQIERKIRIFKESPEYPVYLKIKSRAS